MGACAAVDPCTGTAKQATTEDVVVADGAPRSPRPRMRAVFLSPGLEQEGEVASGIHDEALDTPLTGGGLRSPRPRRMDAVCWKAPHFDDARRELSEIRSSEKAEKAEA